MSSTKPHNNPDSDALFMDADDCMRDGLRAVGHVIYETLAVVKAAVESCGHAPLERQQPLQEVGVHLRQLHGALSMLQFEQGARLLREAESVVRALLDGEERSAEACNLLLRAINELQATPGYTPASPAGAGRGDRGVARVYQRPG